MKLKNKKTGEVFDALIREKGGAGSYSLIVCDIKSYEQSKSTLDETHFVLDEYETLAELLDEWEDYVPKEPLIKDEKIRKAVRAWAEANEREYLLVIKSGGRLEISDGSPHLIYISFHVDNDTLKILDDRTYYPIGELCGEEEE